MVSLERPVDGVHRYFNPPEALSCTLLPWQIVVSAFTLAVILGCTVMVTLATLLQPLLVAVTVYLPACDGVILLITGLWLVLNGTPLGSVQL